MGFYTTSLLNLFSLNKTKTTRSGINFLFIFGYFCDVFQILNLFTYSVSSIKFED
jgi:hypothetical protein